MAEGSLPPVRDPIESEAETTPTPNSVSDDLSVEKYSYIAKGYTTEVFKIELVNIPERMGYQVRQPHCGPTVGPLRAH